MASPEKVVDNKDNDTIAWWSKNASSATPWLDKAATEKDVLKLIDDLDHLMSVSPCSKSTFSLDGKVLYGGDSTEMGELEWNHSQPFFFWKDEKVRKEEASKTVSGEQIFEWSGASRWRKDIRNTVVTSCCERVGCDTEWRSVMVGERKFTGLGVNYVYRVKKGEICPECVALITLRKEYLVLGRYLGNPNVCDSRILGIRLHEDFFKDGPVRISVKVVSGPHETYEQFRNRLLMTAHLLRFEGTFRGAGENDSYSHKPPLEIQPVCDVKGGPILRVPNAKVNRIERWPCSPFIDSMLGAVMRVTDQQKPSSLASFLVPLILDVVGPRASPDDYLIPLVWKLLQDLDDAGGLASCVKNGVAAPRLVVLSGNVAACQRVYGVACSLARASMLQATVDDVRYLVLDRHDMHKAVEQESLEIVLDLFQQSEFSSNVKRQTVLLSEAHDETLESAAIALLKPNCAEVYEDVYDSPDEPGTSRRCPSD